MAVLSVRRRRYPPGAWGEPYLNCRWLSLAGEASPSQAQEEWPRLSNEDSALASFIGGPPVLRWISPPGAGGPRIEKGLRSSHGSPGRPQPLQTHRPRLPGSMTPLPWAGLLCRGRVANYRPSDLHPQILQARVGSTTAVEGVSAGCGSFSGCLRAPATPPE
ncbi:hypothetical protein NDU88_008098 [Pleurodeles waltl]|uniref:Uncharacterized protein n=1 Tax=Pleurodeles waltl TaxID=8319 RepID=A0AAV7QTQ1_PLEWA|nr:hypothetical protein NDU88_008098 [Pleurodeles waltl]